MSKIINKFKFPNDNNEYQINAAQLEGKTLDQIKAEIGDVGGEIPQHNHSYTPAGVINEAVIEEVTTSAKPIDDMVSMPALNVSHTEDTNTLILGWTDGSVSQDSIVINVDVATVTPTFSGTTDYTSYAEGGASSSGPAIQVVDSLPPSPDDNTLYFIK